MNQLNRRQVLAGAAKTFLGVSVLDHLNGSAFAAGENTSPLKQVPTAHNVIYLYMTGGMSHLDTFDPKEDKDVMGLSETIKTKADDVQLSANLPLLARQADKLALVRSMQSSQGAHEQGRYFMRTSFAPRSSILPAAPIPCAPPSRNIAPHVDCNTGGRTQPYSESACAAAVTAPRRVLLHRRVNLKRLGSFMCHQ